MSQPCASPEATSSPARFDAVLDRQLTLCHALEALADSLPDRIDTASAMELAEDACEILSDSHDLEENVVFPALLSADPQTEPVLKRLSAEHVEDEDLANDLRRALTGFGRGQPRNEAEQIGYMLRCLFTSLRRHVAFERDHLLPLYRRSCRVDATVTPLHPRVRPDRAP